MSKNKTVFIVTQTFPPAIGGIETVMLELSKRFSNDGYDVVVFSDKKFDASLEDFSVIPITVPKFLRKHAKKLALYIRAKKTPPSIVVCDSWKSIEAVPNLISCRVCVLAHGQEYLVSARKKRRVEKNIIKSDIVVPSSQYTADLVALVSAEAIGKTHVIYPTYSITDPGDIEKKHRRPRRRLLSISRLDKRKGHSQVLEGLASIIGSLPPFEWVIAGDGPSRRPLEKLATELGLSSYVRFIGKINDIEKEKLLLESDLFLMPSVQLDGSVEGFGISYVEAASYGIPSIAGRSGGAIEAVIDGQTGWNVDPNNIAKLSSVLLEVISDREELLSRGIKAKKTFLESFAGDVSWAKFKLACGLD